MQITLVANPNITVHPGKPNPWKKMEVLYKNMDGKVMTKTLVSFKNPTVFKVFADAKQGDVFEVESVQGEPNAEGKQFYEWKSAHAVNSGEQVVDASGTPAKPVSKMVVTEADRNRFIVRQSSLERAVETLAGQGVLTFESVTSLAERYEAWVFRPVGDNSNKAVEKEASQEPVAAATAARKPGRPRKVAAAPEGTELLDTAEVE